MQTYILLPCSEGKKQGGEHLPEAVSGLPSEVKKLVLAVQKIVSRAKPDKLADLFEVKGKALEKAVQSWKHFEEQPLMPAIQRYDGVMFDFLDYNSLVPSQKESFDRQALIFSALYGVVGSQDLIADYKLKITAKLPSVGALAAFWKKSLKARLQFLNGQIVFNFLPKAHEAMLPAIKPALMLRFRFETKGESGYKTVTHWSKALKGPLIRWILAHNPRTDQDFAGLCLANDYKLALFETETGTLVFRN